MQHFTLEEISPRKTTLQMLKMVARICLNKKTQMCYVN